MAVRELILKLVGQADTGALSRAAGNIGDIDNKAKAATGSAGKFGSALGAVGTIAGGVVAGAGLVALPGLLLSGAKGAAEDEASLDRLRQAIDNTGSSSADYGDTISDLISKGQDLAFSDGEVSDALGTLVSLTGDTEEGMSRLAAAQDLARGANISLEQAAKLLGKTSDENTSALGRLGIALGEGATATDVLAAVQQKFGGQAQQYASSAAGEYAKFQQQLIELQETVGSALIPVFMAFAPFLQAIVPVVELIGGALQKLTSNTPGVIALGLALAVAFLPLTGTALLIAGVVAAIAALGAIAYTYRDQIIGAFQSVLDFIKEHWVLIVTILGGPLGAAVAQIITHWDEIQAVFTGAWEFVSDLLTGSWATIESLVTAPVDAAQEAVATTLGLLQDVFSAAWSFVSDLLTGSWSTVTSLMQAPVDLAQAAIQGYIDLVIGYYTFLWETVSGLLSGAWSTVESLLSSPVNAGKDAISTALTTVRQFFTDLPGQITAALSGFATLLIQHGTDLITGLLNGIQEAWSGLYGAAGWLMGLGAKAVAAVGSLFTTLWQAGRDLLQGFWNGLQSIAQSVLGWLEDFANQAVDAVTNPLGLWSPSRVFYKMGQDTMLGFQLGLEDGAAGVMETMAAISQGVVTAGEVGLGTRPSGRGGPVYRQSTGLTLSTVAGTFRPGLYGGSGAVYTPDFGGSVYGGNRPGYNWHRPMGHGRPQGYGHAMGYGRPQGYGHLPYHPTGFEDDPNYIPPFSRPSPSFARGGPVYLVLPDGRVLAEVVSEEQATSGRVQGLFRSFS